MNSMLQQVLTFSRGFFLDRNWAAGGGGECNLPKLSYLRGYSNLQHTFVWSVQNDSDRRPRKHKVCRYYPGVRRPQQRCNMCGRQKLWTRFWRIKPGDWHCSLCHLPSIIWVFAQLSSPHEHLAVTRLCRLRSRPPADRRSASDNATHWSVFNLFSSFRIYTPMVFFVLNI